MLKKTIAIVMMTTVVFTLSTQSLATSEQNLPPVPITVEAPLEEPVEKPPEQRVFFGTFKPPLEKWVITSQFGIREDVWGGPDQDFHKGTDLVPIGSNKNVMASADGVVITHYLPPGTVRGSKVFKGHPIYGSLIIIAHEGGVYTLYSHMSKTFIHEGQIVKQGDTIGVVGSTGKATGVHLHFEILFDPMMFCF